MAVPTKHFINLGLAFGFGGNGGIEGTAWDMDTGLTACPGNAVCFVKHSSSAFNVTGGMFVGNTNTLGLNSYTKFKMYHTDFNRTGLDSIK